MAQLKMHATEKTERTISGYGSQGIMCATVLKTIKEQFAKPSAVSRAYITNLTDKPKIQDNDRQALQELFFYVLNCVAALKQIVHLPDQNATDNLRKAVIRMPDHLIHKWKDVASDLREKRENPSSFGIVSKPNFDTFRIPIPHRKIVFSQVKKNKENSSSVICVLKTIVLLVAQLFRVVLLMQNPACKKPASVVFFV